MKNLVFKLTLLEWLGIISIFIVFLSQLIYINPFVSSWDQVDFSLAVQRFDLMEMQPHFPGYPFFILGGKLLHLVVSQPSQALTAFAILFYASALFPLYRLLRKRISRPYSFLVTSVMYTTSYCVITVNQPMSEGPALAAMWWYVWGLEHAINSKYNWVMLVPLALLSLLLGIRLSYLPFAIGLFYLFYLKVKNDKIPIKKILYYSIWGAILQLIWVIGLILSEGSLKGFIKLSLAFTSGHFTDWGGAIETDHISFFERVYLFIWKNILWTGTFAESWLTAILFFILIGIILFQRIKKNQPTNTLLYWLFSSYFLWALLAQNIEKARHVLPIVLMFILFVMLKLFLKKPSAIIIGVVVLILLFQVNRDVKLLKVQASEKPAVYQMNDYIQHLNESVILYTWEETRVLQYLQAPYFHKRIETYQWFKLDAKYYHGKTVLLTDKVVEGFKAQGVDLDGKIKKLKTFHSNELFDPVYHDITLYKWIE
ncbi:hypothetical protein IEC97_07025 [Neobacillus cucumis]|uniref:hypothetical protein n=1 Tax=Neobacillus cucumis TaxID=1740721 RepID=UPI0018DFED7F|nr:hypothetical protein [Neobacillus cucumis]MBI0577108.1 hypothetical protein [Neobacillus cucumis]